MLLLTYDALQWLFKYTKCFFGESLLSLFWNHVVFCWLIRFHIQFVTVLSILIKGLDQYIYMYKVVWWGRPDWVAIVWSKNVTLRWSKSRVRRDIHNGHNGPKQNTRRKVHVKLIAFSKDRLVLSGELHQKDLGSFIDSQAQSYALLLTPHLLMLINDIDVTLRAGAKNSFQIGIVCEIYLGKPETLVISFDPF